MGTEINKSICNIIASGSTGNCEIYNKSIAVDVGVSFSIIKPYLFDLQIMLLSHLHYDHFNINTITRLSKERPTLRFGCGGWLKENLSSIRNVDIFDLNKWYDYGTFKVSIGKLYHDVENCFFRIFIKQPNGEYFKIFRATDTAHLEGITAKGYDLYCIESNYNSDTIFQIIQEKESRGEFAYQRGAINSHLSEQQANDFFFSNKKNSSLLIRLHESLSSL